MNQILRPNRQKHFPRPSASSLPSSQRDVYENAFHLEIIRGIGQFCNQRRYVNTVITGEDDAEVLDAIQSMVANTQADGFILLYSKKDCPVAAYLRSEGLLHVIVGKAAQSANQTIYIDNDNALAGEEATDYLYEMGHRRIAYFGVSNAMLFLPSGNAAIRCLCLSTASPRAKGTAWRSIP